MSAFINLNPQSDSIIIFFKLGQWVTGVGALTTSSPTQVTSDLTRPDPHKKRRELKQKGPVFSLTTHCVVPVYNLQALLFSFGFLSSLSVFTLPIGHPHPSIFLQNRSNSTWT